MLLLRGLVYCACFALLLVFGASCVEDSSSDSPPPRIVDTSDPPEVQPADTDAVAELKSPSAEPAQSLVEEQVFEPTAYEIVVQKDLSLKALKDKPLSQHTTAEIESLPMNVRQQFSIAVGDQIQAGQIEPTVRALIELALLENEDVDEIVVFVYTDPELVGEAYDVAKAEWAPGGEWGSTTPAQARSNDKSSHRLILTVRDDLEEYLELRGQRETRFGFTVEERRQIYTELVLAEDRAYREAEQAYPIDPLDPDYREGNFEKYMDKENELAELYEAQVHEKYGIDADIALQISVEAYEKRWPMPDIE